MDFWVMCTYGLGHRYQVLVCHTAASLYPALSSYQKKTGEKRETAPLNEPCWKGRNVT